MTSPRESLFSDSIKDAVFAFVATSPPSEWAQISEAVKRIYGPPPADSPYSWWATGTPEYRGVHEAFHALEAEGKIRYGSHLGWRLA